MNVAAYADRATARKARAYPPRNAAAAGKRARENGEPLLVSFIGDTHWSSPTVYCDSGARYDWSFVDGLATVIVVKGGVDARHALREILERTDTLGAGYPVLLDIEAREVAYVVHGSPLNLWQVRRGTATWLSYFSEKP